MILRASFGSGLTRRPDDPPDIVWGVGDRGPNIKVKTLVEHYGADDFRPYLGRKGAKVMPSPAIGPSIARLRIGERSGRASRNHPPLRPRRRSRLRPADPRRRAGSPRAGFRPRRSRARARSGGLRHRGDRRHPRRRLLDRRRIRAVARSCRRRGSGQRPVRSRGHRARRRGLRRPGRAPRHRRAAPPQPGLRGARALRRREVAVPRLPEPARPPGRRGAQGRAARSHLAPRRSDARGRGAISLSARPAGALSARPGGRAARPVRHQGQRNRLDR